LDILEIRDFENRLIHSKGDTEEAAMEEDWGYGGSTPDPDGF